MDNSKFKPYERLPEDIIPTSIDDIGLRTREDWYMKLVYCAKFGTYVIGIFPRERFTMFSKRSYETMIVRANISSTTSSYFMKLRGVHGGEVDYANDSSDEYIIDQDISMNFNYPIHSWTKVPVRDETGKGMYIYMRSKYGFILFKRPLTKREKKDVTIRECDEMNMDEFEGFSNTQGVPFEFFESKDEGGMNVERMREDFSEGCYDC